MDDAPKDAVVQIRAEGKEHACAIGVMTMSTDDVRTVNKDIGVNNIHYLNDGLWKVKTFA